MKTIHLLFICALSLLWCCKNEAPIAPPVIRTSFQENPLDSAFAKVRPTVQSFQINTNKTNTIKAEKGTQILIPENCFVNHLGQAVTEDVEIEVIEAFSLSDFVSADLTTLSDGKLLLSNGMMYIDAKANGQSLNLKEGSELSINMPTMKANDGYQIFTGDGKNWTVDSSAIEEEYLIPFSLDLLYPPTQYFSPLVSYHNNWQIGKLDSLTNPKFENTLIATTEFKNRIPWILYMATWMGMLNQEDFFFEQENYDFMFWGTESDLFKVYLNHSNEKIEVVDSMAKQLFWQYFEQHEKELNNLITELNDYYQYKDNRMEQKQYILKHGPTIENEFRTIIDLFSDTCTDKGKVKLNDNQGIDLDADNATQQLKNLGIGNKKINEIFSYHLKKQSKLKKIKEENDKLKRAHDKAKKLVHNKATVRNIYESTSFSTEKMGWINCDRFYNDPKAAPAEILVKNNSSYDLEFVDYSLVIPDMNVRLMSFPRKNGQHGFTKEEGPYTKLPIGKEAVIVGVSMQNDSLFYGYKNIKIEDNLSVAIDMEYTTASKFKQSLDMIFKVEI